LELNRETPQRNPPNADGLQKHRWHQRSGGSCDRVSQLRAALGPKFTIMSGDDSLTLPFMAVGANGRHQRRVQCDSQRGFADGEIIFDRQIRSGDSAAWKILPAVQGFVHRDNPTAGESRASDDENHRGRISPAARADEPEKIGMRSARR